MKFKILRSKFLDGLKAVQNIVGGKGSLPILQNVLIESGENEIKFTTTDLDISIKATIECEIIEAGSTTLPVKLLFTSISKAAECEIEVEVDTKDRASIKAGTAKFKLAGLPSSEFPHLPEDGNASVYKLSQTTLKEMFRKTSYAASQDDTRRTLKGVLISLKNSKITMVATDGRRLAMVENEMNIEGVNEKDIVLPSKAVNELQRMIGNDEEISIFAQQSQVCFKMDNIQIYSKLVDDVYPNYEQVIPKERGNIIKIDRQLLLDALDRASVMTMDEAHSTKLIFEENRLIVTSAASDIGEAKDEVAIKYVGEKIDILFNPSYVMDPLKAIDDDEIEFDIRDGHSPAVIRCSIPFLYVLMPLRIN